MDKIPPIYLQLEEDFTNGSMRVAAEYDATVD